MQKIFEYYKKLYSHNREWGKTILNWFILAAVVGFITYFINQTILEKITQNYASLFGSNPALDFHLVIGIFLQNLFVSAIALFGGILLGLAPILVVAVNGFLIGYVLASILSISAPAFLVISLAIGGLVPHGIFEVPAFLIASTLGLRLGLEWTYNSAKGERWQTFKNNLKNSVYTFPAIALILFVAAIVEVFVSGKIVDMFK